MEVEIMTEERKQQIVEALLSIASVFIPTEEESYLTMFGLISRYNATHENTDIEGGKLVIGGDWVIENCPEPLKSLPV